MRFVASLSLLMATLSCQVVFATEILTLTLVGPDLSAVPVGSPVTIGVELIGLSPGASLDSLAATITYDGSLVSVPNILTGASVPNPLADPLDLLSTADVGLADVAFLTFGLNGSDQIQSNGVFFTFDVTPTQIGSGAFHFDFVGGTQFNAANPNLPLTANVTSGADLPFNIVAVPEPASAVLALLSALLMTNCKRLA